MSRRLWLALGVLLVAGMVLTACTAPQIQRVEKIVTQVVEKQVEVVNTVVVEKPVEKVVTRVVEVTPQAPAGPKVLRLNMGAGDVPTIDPGLATDSSSIQIDIESFVGLTRQSEITSLIEPGMATRWDISPDGRVYTFTLRSDVPWVKFDGEKVVKVQSCPDADGKTEDRMVTAHDFEYGILRTLKPETASDYAYVLTFAIQGADDFNTGAITDTTKVGVKALDDATLEIRFNEPAAYNAAIAGMWPAYAVPGWVIEGNDCTEARGERWTEPGFFQSYGPFTLKEWVHDSTISIIKNPFWPGADNIPTPKLDEVRFSMLDQTAALAEYEAGNVDMTSVPLGDIDRLKGDPVLSREFRIGPQMCTYYYGFNTVAPYVDDARVRRALSMAIDRQALVDNVTKGGQQPARWFARPGLAGAPTLADHPDLGIKFDVEKADAELSAYLAEKGLTRDKLDITLMFNTSSGHQKIAEAIQQMWKDNLGVDVKLANQEVKVYLKTTLDPVNTPQIFRLGWCMDYADANNFDREVFAVGGSQNPAQGGGVNWENAEFEKLVIQAARELDPAVRVDLYAQAEEILVNTDAAIAPIYWYTGVSLTKPYVQRTYGVWGQELFEKWDITR
jgi:oligopeptide transport system substrate-binding protein